jgi:hypothetical protein
MKRPKINLFHIKSVKELEEWQEYVHSQPSYRMPDTSKSGYEKQLDVTHVVVGRDMPCPFEGGVEPGALVHTDWHGVSAWWLNGTLYVRKDLYDKYKREHPQEE